MEHRPLSHLKIVAEVSPAETAPVLSAQQRLERWIEVLEATPDRRLRSLFEIEYLPLTDRRNSRADNSPLTVAYEDPLLRAQGLTSDRVGDCMDFFEITDREMHRAYCSCHVGANLTGKRAAAQLRRMQSRRDRLRVVQRMTDRILSFVRVR